MHMRAVIYRGVPACTYRACLSVSTGLSLHRVSVCVYRGCLSVSTGEWPV